MILTNLSFRRITSTGNFIPQIDGLRFIAIFSVVVFHLSGFITVRDQHTYGDGLQYNWLVYILSHGHLGVPLFFVISGLILALPFASHHIKGTKEIKLGAYFLRRLSRLEPPYILAMTVLFFASVYVAKTLSLHEGLKSYICSVFYCNNIVYGNTVLPLINCVTWSLEVEVQFYILAPLLANVFRIQSAFTRRMVLLVSVIVSAIVGNSLSLPFISLIDYLEYFLLGFLVADFYLAPKQADAGKLLQLLGLLAFAGIWAFDGNEIPDRFLKTVWELFFIACVFVFFYLVLLKNAFTLLSNTAVTAIGGMCYSIYLLHYPIISLAGNFIVRHRFFQGSLFNGSTYVVFILSCILLVSSVYFILIERPCMKKDWYRFSGWSLFKIKPAA